MADSDISFDLTLDLDKFSRGLKTAEDAALSTGKKFENIGHSLTNGFTSAFGGIQGKLLALGSAIGGAFALHKVVESGLEATESVRKLNQALQSTGQFTPAASKALQEHAAALKDVVAVDDDVIMRGQAVLVQFGKLKGEALDRATQAALDLSTRMGGDVAGAFDLVEKAANGQVSTLRRMGFDIKATGDKATDFARALSVIESSLGGAAAAEANTFGGALRMMKISFGDVAEEIGKLIVNSPVITGILKVMGDAFRQIALTLSQLGESGDPLGDVVTKLLNLATTLVQYVIPPFELLYNVGNIVFTSIATVANEFLGVFFRVAQAVTGFISSVTGQMQEANQVLQDLVAANAAAQVEISANSQKAFDDIFDFSKTAKAEAFAQSLEDAVSKAAASVKTASEHTVGAVQTTIDGITWSGVTAQMGEFDNKVKVTSTSIAQNLNQNIVSGFANAGAAIGGALAKGENAFEAFGKAVLKSLGQILMMFGNMLIAVGIGLATVPMLFGLSGTAAIAAGVAATVLGGAMMALAGGGGQAATGSGATAQGGAASGGAASLDSSSSAPKIEEQKHKAVTINIQGSYFETEQTKIRLVEMIRESSDATDFAFRSL